MAQKLTIALLLGAGLAAAATAQPQEQEWWNGKTITRIELEGFALHRWEEVDPLSPPLRVGQVLTPELRDRAVQKLFQVGWFDYQLIRIEPVADPGDPGGVVVVVHVRELPIVTELRIVGVSKAEEAGVRSGFRLLRGRELDPYKLHMDRTYLERHFRGRGYPWAMASAKVDEAGDGTARLTWRVRRGPRGLALALAGAAAAAAVAVALWRELFARRGKILAIGRGRP